MVARSEPQEPAVTAAFVELADNLVNDFDVLDLLHTLVRHCVALLDTAAAGLLLVDEMGHLRLLASSNEQAHLVELFQVETDEPSPCTDCFRTGRPVTAVDIAQHAATWPGFATEAQRRGFRTVHALPMRLRSDTIGTLNLFRAEPTALDHDDLVLAQALADVATIAILQHRALARRDVLIEQLQGALNSRVVIEQAKGVLADRGRLDVDTAFNLLRRYARTHHARLSGVAWQVVTDRGRAEEILGWAEPTSHGQRGDGPP
ncbi:GAF and ANTAR domain-containing protein [Saccharopolyspora sp. WRP15-2]|uniref:GAF and ANTAR domain-containing protein n=1 Tax=Saccharopolyspora oryzae TaxID=2997343 RepID=A0ABT4URN6_9PSEU|nr:GAF and ANTAR domain-containing protein [Saccharopolyspora oryzae]MDA3623911.1 GAF and ANTAR domain-containing protein [Saccharopolyspora oryzae]